MAAYGRFNDIESDFESYSECSMTPVEVHPINSLLAELKRAHGDVKNLAEGYDASVDDDEMRAYYLGEIKKDAIYWVSHIKENEQYSKLLTKRFKRDLRRSFPKMPFSDCSPVDVSPIVAFFKDEIDVINDCMIASIE